MRNSSVSGPVQCCNAAELSAPGLRFVAVHLLTKQVLYFIVEVSQVHDISLIL